jgi:hypothetical protein
MNNYALLGTPHNKNQIYSRALVTLKDFLPVLFTILCLFFIEICFGVPPVMPFRINEFHHVLYRTRYVSCS